MFYFVSHLFSIENALTPVASDDNCLCSGYLTTTLQFLTTLSLFKAVGICDWCNKCRYPVLATEQCDLMARIFVQYMAINCNKKFTIAKNAKVGSKFCPILINPWKNCHRLLKRFQSGKISPNLVTLRLWVLQECMYIVPESFVFFHQSDVMSDGMR